jgi:hypothetical protein
MTMTVPALFLSPLTLNEVSVDPFALIYKYVSAANNTQDHVERMKLITTGYIASFYASIVSVGAMVPIASEFGETLEGVLTDGDSEARYYMES